MRAITVNFTDEERARFVQKANESGIPAEELIRLSVISLVSQDKEADFNDIKSYLFEKFGDVYRKLA